MLVPNMVTTIRTMDTQSSHNIVFHEWICWWSMRRLRKTVNTQDEETKRFLMQQCWLPDHSFLLFCFMDSRKPVQSSQGTHLWERNLKTQMVNRFPFWTISCNKKKWSQESLRLLRTSLGRKRSLKVHLRSLMMPNIKVSLID